MSGGWTPAADDPVPELDDGLPFDYGQGPWAQLEPEEFVEPGAGSVPDEPPLEFDPRMFAAELEQLAAAQQDSTDHIASLEQAVGEHTEVLEQLVDMLSGQPGGPWLWDGLSDEKRTALWGELGEWVAWLERRWLANLTDSKYRLPACWYRHAPGVELLTALMVAHKAVYTTKVRSPTTLLVEWHTRYFVPVFELLSDLRVYTNCINQRDHVVAADRPLVHDAAAFEAFVKTEGAKAPVVSAETAPRGLPAVPQAGSPPLPRR